ncbi:NAD(P)H-hydrate dehydratase [Agrilutibacter solisilvae]|uniref:Bifunctional NAD(P)H-hydrate repair enzyme n=1 Tax=Agrilutibacter solisilvae TaxID=2763317 RepID=A0A974XWX7_9GAMM|nr:NAD(P)H-hydrate dehydratase [Lysobacter solisilvae]QSX77339.1 NAD(P)H-hydrate dehydratase [Lysobacter solisilvae]
MPTTPALRDVAALRAIEALASQRLGDGFELMRRAGQAAWRDLLRAWPDAHRIVVACGPGNNGGDGYVLARHALESGREVTVVHAPAHAPRGELAPRAAGDFREAGGSVRTDGALPVADLLVDAVFGIGLSRAPEGESATFIDALNAHGAPILSLDVPSGLDADTGNAPGRCIYARRTIEFIAPKAGLRTGAALDYVGDLSLATLALEPAWLDEVHACAKLLQADALASWLPPRARNAHKGSHGRVLCIGGDHGSGGAIMLCAQAALRSGAGLVDVATRELHVPALLARLPEAMAHVPTFREQFEASLERADVIAVGPGLGQESWGEHALDTAMQHAQGRALVLDADALNLVARQHRALPAGTIITPHPGEAARLLDTDAKLVQRDRLAAARELAARYGCVVVLKGAGTIVAAAGRTPRVIAAGNPGMAVGGMGDVLTGVIAALRAQGLAAFDAASAGALLHACAGDAAAAAGERGLLPTDLMPFLRALANPEPVR